MCGVVGGLRRRCSCSECLLKPNGLVGRAVMLEVVVGIRNATTVAARDTGSGCCRGSGSGRKRSSHDPDPPIRCCFSLPSLYSAYKGSGITPTKD